jgi:hypothetical protein
MKKKIPAGKKNYATKFYERPTDVPLKEQHELVEHYPSEINIEKPVYFPGKKNNDHSPSGRNYANLNRLKTPLHLESPRKISRNFIFKLNRWAKSHVIAARIIIVLITAALSTLGILSGKLFAGSIIISPLFDYTAGLIMATCFFILMQREKKKIFILPYQLKRTQAGYLLIALLFVATGFTAGTRIGTSQEQLTPYGYVAQKIENSFTSPAAENQQTEEKNSVGKEDITGLVILYIILILILMFALFCLCCMAFCEAGAAGGIPAVIASILFLWFVMNAMVKHIDGKKPGNKGLKKNNPDTLD